MEKQNRKKNKLLQSIKGNEWQRISIIYSIKLKEKKKIVSDGHAIE